MKVKSYEADNWKVHDKECTVSEIRVAIKYDLPTSMQDELDDHQEDYRSLAYEDRCDLLSTIQVKDDRKRAATQIKKIASPSAASISDSDGSFSIPSKKKDTTGVLRSNKGPHKKAPKNNVTQQYCVLYNKAGIPERNVT